MKKQRVLLCAFFGIWAAFFACAEDSSNTSADNAVNNIEKTETTNTGSYPDSLLAAPADSPTIRDHAEYTDSAHFHITRRYYVSGKPYLINYSNKRTLLDSCRTFYENGVLKEEGLMTSLYHINVGTWKSYSRTGQIETSTDYDKLFPVSYFKALTIAASYGYHNPDIDIALHTSGKRTAWEITRWKADEIGRGRNGEQILIDTKTGKITRPAGVLYAIY